MKKLLGIVVLGLLLSISVKADDIRDFQIEDISLYDSALKHFSKTKIDNSKKVAYRDNTFTSTGLSSQKLKNYETIQFTHKTDDKNYIIKDITGTTSMDYEKCMKEIKKISSEFDTLFPNTQKSELMTYKHTVDKSGKSKISDIIWQFKNMDVIVIACYDWSEKEKWPDSLRISISSKEANEFFSSNPY